MSDIWTEPGICRGCVKPRCSGYPSECELEARETEGDRKCHMKREGEI